MGKEGELWHLVEAKREDDSPTIFRIRELEPRLHQKRIFVAELPYPVADGSRLPDAPSYRRFATFEEQWLDPACNALGWTAVAVKIEDGSFFVYLYGSDEPRALIERLSPFDGALAFFDEHDPTWDEYAALKELLDEAKTLPPRDDDEVRVQKARPKSATIKAGTKQTAKTKPKAKATSKPKPAAKAKGNAKAKVKTVKKSVTKRSKKR